MNLFLYLHPNFEAVFKGTSPGKTARKKGQKVVIPAQQNQRPDSQNATPPMRDQKRKSPKKGQKSPKKGQKSPKKGQKSSKKGQKSSKRRTKSAEAALTREIKAAFPEKRRTNYNVMTNSRFPSPDHKLVTGDPVQILLGNE